MLQGALFCLILFFKEGSEGDFCLTGEMLRILKEQI